MKTTYILAANAADFERYVLEKPISNCVFATRATDLLSPYLHQVVILPNAKKHPAYWDMIRKLDELVDRGRITKERIEHVKVKAP